MSEQIDRLGVVAGSLCAVHCAMAALIPTMLSALGLGLLLSQEMEWAFVIAAIVIAISSAILSWRRVRSRFVVACLSLGVIGLLSSRAIEMSSAHHAHRAHDAHHANAHHAVKHQTAEHHTTEHQGAHQGDERHAPDHTGSHDVEHGSAVTLGDERGVMGNANRDLHEDAHHDSSHLLGVIFAVFAGVCLLLGHISNIRLIRRQVSG